MCGEGEEAGFATFRTTTLIVLLMKEIASLAIKKRRGERRSNRDHGGSMAWSSAVFTCHFMLIRGNISPLIHHSTQSSCTHLKHSHFNYILWMMEIHTPYSFSYKSHHNSTHWSISHGEVHFLCVKLSLSTRMISSWSMFLTITRTWHHMNFILWSENNYAIFFMMDPSVSSLVYIQNNGQPKEAVMACSWHITIMRNEAVLLYILQWHTCSKAEMRWIHSWWWWSNNSPCVVQFAPLSSLHEHLPIHVHLEKYFLRNSKRSLLA